jgi:hypothetical protein
MVGINGQKILTGTVLLVGAHHFFPGVAFDTSTNYGKCDSVLWFDDLPQPPFTNIRADIRSAGCAGQLLRIPI